MSCGSDSKLPCNYKFRTSSMNLFEIKGLAEFRRGNRRTMSRTSTSLPPVGRELDARP
jgi:hypothetical protein